MDVILTRSAIVLNEQMELLGRAFFLVETMGLTEEEATEAVNDMALTNSLVNACNSFREQV